MHELSHHCIRKPRLKLVAQRLAFHLERRHTDGFESRRKLILSYGFVALCKTGDEEEHQDEEGNTDWRIHWRPIVSHTPQIFTDRMCNPGCFNSSFYVVDADDVGAVE